MSKAASHDLTVTVPIVGEAEMPVMPPPERETFLKSIDEARRQIESGDYVEFESERFLEFLRAEYRDLR